MRRVPALLLVLALGATPALALSLAPLLAGPGAAASITHDWVPSFDGKRLRVTWFEPDAPPPWPVVLRTHGWALQREV